MEGVQLRRVQQTGGSTLIISLPKEWAESVGIKKLDEVLLVPQPDSSIIVIPKRVVNEEATIDVEPHTSPDSILRCYLSNYIAGFNIIRLKLQRPNPELMQSIKDRIRRWLIGVEVVEESALEMITQVLPTHTNLPLKKAIERMSKITSSMQKEAIDALDRRDDSLANEIIRRDDEVDRFYHFIARQLNIALSNPVLLHSLGLSFKHDCLGYMLVAKSIERSADHAASIARVVGQVKGGKSRIPHQLAESGLLSNKLFEDASRALLMLNVKLAEDVLSRVDYVVNVIDDVNSQLARHIRNPSAVSHFRLALENIKRIAEYSADISEVVVNLSVSKPGTTWLQP